MEYETLRRVPYNLCHFDALLYFCVAVYSEVELFTLLDDRIPVDSSMEQQCPISHPFFLVNIFLHFLHVIFWCLQPWGTHFYAVLVANICGSFLLLGVSQEYGVVKGWCSPTAYSTITLIHSWKATSSQ